ncbi:hypothetical protein Tco_0892186 [Tanacetum coccineum]|uniref:Uncharacterized protein n=1 Tax=Tanacetum coccineum TaxID=301880 RepID=A0ABQ5C6S3_9ASTR
MVVEDDHDVIHDNNSSDLALSANLNDLDFRTLNIDDDIPYDLADSDNEVLANYDDDDEVATMVAEVAPGHGGDGADDTPPPLVGLIAVANPKRGRGRGGKDRGRMGARKATKNIELKKVIENYNPHEIEFDWNDQGTFTHVGKNHALFSNYVSELVRDFSMHYPSWNDIEEEKKGHFDLKRHMHRPRWTTIVDDIENYFAKRYSNNKYNLKRDYWKAKGGAPTMDALRSQPPPNVERSD